MPTSSAVKDALSRYSVFYVDFLRSKMAARRLEAAAPANDSQALTALFFFTCSELRDRSTSDHQWVSTLAKSFPSLGPLKLGFEIGSSKLKQTSFPWTMVKNAWNPKQACRAPRIDLELSWSGDRSRLSIFQVQLYISLHSTMYTTKIDRQDTCWARFVWKDARPPLFFPTTKWRKKSLNSVTVQGGRPKRPLRLFLYAPPSVNKACKTRL